MATSKVYGMFEMGMVQADAIDDGNGRLTGEWMVEFRRHRIPGQTIGNYSSSMVTCFLDSQGGITSHILHS